MKTRSLLVPCLLAALSPLAACSVDNPGRPSMSFASPTAQTPANGVLFNFNQQPITLTISNAARTGTEVVTYNLEVSTSAAFASTVLTRNDVPEGANGVTTVTLVTLDGNTTYYWRSRAVVNGIAGEPSQAKSFFVRPNIVIQAPSLASPTNGEQVFGARPSFTVTNAARTGPAGTIFYEFQVSASAAFGSLTATATVQEQTSQTSWTPSSDLPEGALFWRVRASDPANAITSAFSNAVQFDRRFGIDLSAVTWVAALPGTTMPDVSKWPQTRTITSASHGNGVLCIEQSGANWPSADFLGDPSVQVEGNQVMFIQRDNRWYGSAGHWFRPGQTCKGEVDEQFFLEAFHNPPFDSLVLHSGDVFGVMVTTPSRSYPQVKTIDQRSNAVLVVW